MAVFRAIQSCDTEALSTRIVGRGLVDLQWRLPAAPDVPELLRYCPSALSIAAFFDARDSLTFLLSNQAKIDVSDRHVFLGFMAFSFRFPFSASLCSIARLS